METRAPRPRTEEERSGFPPILQLHVLQYLCDSSFTCSSVLWLRRLNCIHCRVQIFRSWILFIAVLDMFQCLFIQMLLESAAGKRLSLTSLSGVAELLRTRAAFCRKADGNRSDNKPRSINHRRRYYHSIKKILTITEGYSNRHLIVFNILVEGY